MPAVKRVGICLLLAIFAASALAAAPSDFVDSQQALSPTTQPSPFLLHLPGIGGIRWSDRQAARGLREGGFTGTIQIYDWTANDPGMDALLAQHRNRAQAARVASILADRAAADPSGKILLMGHSGGGAMAIWALEDLPPGVRVDDVLLMSPAISPGYDLSKALTHVRGHMYVFSSLADILVLGTGTTLFGTMDGVKSDAAGRVGFTMPPTADAEQYKKLVPEPYDPNWMKFNDFGDHIGGMNRSFARNVLAPLLIEGKLPPTSMPTTEMATGLGRAQPTTLPAR